MGEIQNALKRLTKKVTGATSSKTSISGVLDDMADNYDGASTAYVDEKIAEAVTSVYKYKGSVSTYSNLPTTGRKTGDVYNVLDTGKNYAWDGHNWDDLAGFIIANPSGEGSVDLTKLQIGDTIYLIPGAEDIEELKETKANKDGYYSTMGVGHADSALSLDSNVGNDDQTPFNYQTAGGDSDITTGIQSLKKLVGASVVFNQLNSIENNTYTENGITFTIANYKVTISGTASANASWYNYNPVIRALAGKKVLVVFNSKTGVSITSVGTSSAIIIPSSSNNYGFAVANGTDLTTPYETYLQIFDLTQMFGSQVADYIYAKEQANAGDGVAIFKGMFPNDYYAYNTGSFIHSKSAKLKMVDYNQLDNSTFVKGRIDNGAIGYASDTSSLTTTNNSITFTTTTGYRGVASGFINVIPNERYDIIYTENTEAGFYCDGYDNEGNWVARISLTTITANSHYKFDIPSNVSKIRLSIQKTTGGTTTVSNVYLFIYWDGSRIGYEPYQEHIYELPNDELKGVLKIVNNKIVADGDEEYPDGTKKTRYSSYTFTGNEDWLSRGSGTGGDLYSIDLPMALAKPDFTSALLVANGYYLDGGAYSGSVSGTIGLDNARAYICVPSGANPNTIFANGVVMQYELVEPTESTSTAFAENIYVDDFGTMEFLDENNARISGIQGNEIFYKANISGFAESLYVKTDGNPDDLATLEDISDTALATRGYIKLTSITGYDATKTQVLKNINGVFTWVDEV